MTDDFLRAPLLLTLRCDGVDYDLPLGQTSFYDRFYVDTTLETGHHFRRLRLVVHPKAAVALEALAVSQPMTYRPTDRLLANGFQSWSETRAYAPGAAVPRLRAVARPFMGRSGDEHLDWVPRGPGQLHSWTYTTRRAAAGTHHLVGSLGERTCFTCHVHDVPAGRLRVLADVAGLTLEHSFPLLDLYWTTGTAAEVYDRYFALLPRPVAPGPPVLGWTSWYRHYTGVSAAIVRDNLAQWQAAALPPGVIQIDDGWQARVGDWLSFDEAFPAGVAELARAISAAGHRPGLWLAPFLAEAKSELVRQHPDWLLRDTHGRPLRVLYNPGWSGWCYALDVYHPGVRDYLTAVLVTITERWGFGLLKLDFLYAACLVAPPGKTRGQVMSDAVSLLIDLCGDAQLLGCGVPLGSVFGRLAYCRTGADIHLRWEHRALALVRHRERVSTRVALRTVLYRYPLDGRAFGVDPDVYLLRDDGQHLTPTQQYTVLLVNALCGRLLFTSDGVGAYGAEQRGELAELRYWATARVHDLEELRPDVFRLAVRRAGEEYAALINLTGKAQEVAGVALVAYESLVVKVRV